MIDAVGTATRARSKRTEIDASGAFARQPYIFDARITADGSSGFPAVPGRYHLYVSHACPWASRSVIVRELKGLDEVVSMSAVDPIRDERGWAFRDGPGHSVDPINGFEFLRDAYIATDPDYDLRPSVPVLWDKQSARIVSNDFSTIDVDLATQFDAFAKNDVDLYPQRLRDEIDELSRFLYENVNDGVYRAGFARSQLAYEAAFDALFEALDYLDRRLASTRFLLGDRLTLADIRLFVTLIRFDAVYHYHFKCNLRRLTDYPHLWGYARDLFQTPGIQETVNFDHIRRHYYMTHPHLNPTRIVPKGPQMNWHEPHHRVDLAGEKTP